MVVFGIKCPEKENAVWNIPGSMYMAVIYNITRGFGLDAIARDCVPKSLRETGGNHRNSVPAKC